VGAYETLRLASIMAPATPFGFYAMQKHLTRACRVMEVGDTGQRFQPKEHQGLVLG
jgi:hypothetical protein